MICHFISGEIDTSVWNRVCNGAASGSNGLWAVALDENNMTGCPVLLGVALPSWTRFQLIKGKYGLTIYGESDNTCLDVKKCLFKELEGIE